MNFNKGYPLLVTLLVAACSNESATLDCPAGSRVIERNGVQVCQFTGTGLDPLPVPTANPPPTSSPHAASDTGTSSSPVSAEPAGAEPPAGGEQAGVSPIPLQVTRVEHTPATSPATQAGAKAHTQDETPTQPIATPLLDEQATANTQEMYEVLFPGNAASSDPSASRAIEEPRDVPADGRAGGTPAPSETLAEAHMTEDGREVMPWELEQDSTEEIKEINERSLAITVKRGDTLLELLDEHNISTAFYYTLSNEDRKRLRQFRIGDKLILKEEEGTLYSLAREISPIKTLIIERLGENYELREEITDPEIRQNSYTFSLNHSLYLDGGKAGLSQNTLANLRDILGERMDFSRDIQKGDQVTLILNEPVHDGQVVGRPTIAAAKVVRAGKKTVYALRYENQGRVRYFDKDGSSLQTGFMRTPTRYSRISSNFNRNRRHPVLGYVRPHLGTDFAAPIGTPIYAASDGVVTRAGWASGYGRVVYIDHGKGIQTRYGHMSKINTRRGRQVSRGDIIGYVGQSGTATGPHLHYEYRAHGKAINAMQVDLPQADPVPASEMASFKKAVAGLLRDMDELQLAQVSESVTD